MIQPKIAQRQFPRLIVKIPVQIFIKSQNLTLEGEILNLSLGGAFIACPQKVEEGQEVEIELKLHTTLNFRGEVKREGEFDIPLNEESVERAFIRWNTPQNEPHPGFGIEFTGLNEAKRNFLKRLIQYQEHLQKAGVDHHSY